MGLKEIKLTGIPAVPHAGPAGENEALATDRDDTCSCKIYRCCGDVYLFTGFNFPVIIVSGSV